MNKNTLSIPMYGLLRDMSSPIIAFFKDQSANHDMTITYACYNNSYYNAMSNECPYNPVDATTEQLLKAIYEFVGTDSLAYEYYGCDCHSDSIAECNEKIKVALLPCIELITSVIKNNELRSFISNNEAFAQDMYSILNNVLEGKIDVIAADKELIYWKGAVTDIELYYAVTYLRYSYIKKLISKYC